jgi:hypothetical protein
MGLPKLNTVDGAVDLNLYGNLSYPLLGSAGSVTLSGAVASITTVDLSGLTTGVVTTEQSSLTLTHATSVKVGSLPASVTLAKAVTVEAHGTTDLGAMSMSAPLATAVTILAGKLTGTVTVSANLAAITIAATEATGITVIHGASVDISKVTKNTAALTISTTTLQADVLKTASAPITLINGATAALPALESLTATFTGAAVSAFTAPKLSVSATATNLIDLKAGATVSVKSLGSPLALTDSNTISGLTVSAQANDIVLDNMVKLATLDYTSTVIGGTLTISTTMVSLTTLTLGSTSKLTTLTVSATNMVTLGTAGVILNTNIVNNTKLETLSFGHTHQDLQAATTVDIINNDKIVALDMSSLGKVKEVEITGNASLTTFTAPSVADKAEPTVSIVVTMTGNDITGTYSATIAATETTAEVPYTASSAAITSWKGFIDSYNVSQNASVTFNLDIDRVDNGSDADGLANNGKFSAAAPNHGSNIDTAAELAKF